MLLLLPQLLRLEHHRQQLHRCPVAQVGKTQHDIAGGAFGFFHDFVVTDNYFVFLENPMALDIWKVLSKYTVGQACIAECLYMVDGKPQKVRGFLSNFH